MEFSDITQAVNDEMKSRPGMATGLLERAKEFIDQFSRKIGVSGDRSVEFLSYFGFGFLVGYFFKKFSTHVFIALGAFVLGLLALETVNVIVIDWAQVRALTGIGPSDTIGALATNYFEWLKAHVAVVAVTFVGFLIGHRVG